MGLYDGGVGVLGCAPWGCTFLEDHFYQVDVAALKGIEEGCFFVVADLIGVDSFREDQLCDLGLVVDACIGKRRSAE